MSESRPEPTIPAEHLPSLLGAALDACVILREANGQLSIVGGNEQWASLSGLAIPDLMRRSPAICMSADLVASVERLVGDGLPGHVVHVEPSEDHLVGTSPVTVSLLAIAPANGQRFVILTARAVGSEREPSIADIALDAMGEAVLVIDRRLAIVHVNPATVRMLGYRREQLLGADVRALAQDGSVTALTEHLGATSSTPSSTRLRLRSRDGGVEVEATTTLVREPEPQVVLCIHDLTHQRAHEATIAGMSAIDALTGLASRDSFLERLRALLDGEHEGERTTLAFLDLDNFKTINDALGHDQGDLVLETIARRLEHNLGEDALVGRFGGDEFVVAAAVATDAEHERVVQGIARSFADPVELSGKELQITTSVGVITAHRSEATTPERVLKAADLAMYEAKRQGKDCVVVYDESLEHRATARIEIESDLRQALESEQFVLHYQPIIDVITGRPVGAEALVRWEHPERGMVRPDQFIPIAEETGLIVPIGAWVLETAVAQVADWNRHRLTRRALGVSVNLSGLQLGDPDLERRVQATLSRHGFDPARLTLEITESMLMIDTAETLALLERFRDMGVRIAIDDFGTGYSSLSYLKRLPARALKIDKSFVDGLGVMNEDTALVTGIVGLASALGLEIVAEGVETELQLKELRRLGCEYSQGYHHSKPLAPDAFERWLNGEDEPDGATPSAPPVLTSVEDGSADGALDRDDADQDGADQDGADREGSVPNVSGVFDQDADTAAYGA